MKKTHDDTPHKRFFLVTYDYEENGQRERYGFLCEAQTIREAAERFWCQHPGPWFSLQKISDGSREVFWHKESGQFVTIPQREEERRPAGSLALLEAALRRENAPRPEETALHRRPPQRRQTRGKEQVK